MSFLNQVMVATVRCEEIANEKLRDLTTDEVFLYLCFYSNYVTKASIFFFSKKKSML